MSEATDLLDRAAAMAKRRDAWRPLWQELADLLHPTRAAFTTDRAPGSELQAEVYDSTPMQARRGLATAIDGLLKPSTTSWFWLKATDEDVNESDEVKRWFEVVQDRMWAAIYSPHARFIMSSGGVDSDLATFGLGHLWISENKDRDGLSFQALFLGDVAYDLNADGVIDTYAITRRFTPRQAFQRFDKDTPPKVMEALTNPDRKSAQQQFEFVQLIFPRENRDPRLRGSTDLPFASKIVGKDDEVVVEESGFHELPIATPRWEVQPGQIYPRSPGMIALPDARTLQSMGHTLLVGGQRAVDPPIWVADDGVLSAVRTWPGGLSVVDSEIIRMTNGRPIGQLEMGANIPVGQEMQHDYRSMVEAAFFKNVFNLPVEGRQMTATEVMERKEEFLRTIGPVMGQLESDYIGHVVERVFGIMMRAGAFPEPPEELQGRNVEFEFMSPIQQARKQIEAAGLSRMLEFVAPLAEADPSILDNIDGDEIVRDMPEIFSARSTWIRPMEEVQSMRQQRSQQMQTQQVLEGAQQGAGAAKDAAQALDSGAIQQLLGGQ